MLSFVFLIGLLPSLTYLTYLTFVGRIKVGGVASAPQLKYHYFYQEDRSKNNIVPLYKSLARPHLEYCVQAWRPYLQQDTNNIVGVQRRMTKIMREVKEDYYEQWVKKTKLMSLEMRRIRIDLIEV